MVILWYDLGMTRHARIAVTVPAETFVALELARKKLRKTRSAAISTAIVEWLRGLETSESDRRYVEGYLRQPEAAGEAEVWTRASTMHWGEWEVRKGRAARAAEPRRVRRR